MRSFIAFFAFAAAASAATSPLAAREDAQTCAVSHTPIDSIHILRNQIILIHISR